MLYQGHDVYTVDHPAVVAELKVTVPTAYPLNRTLSMEYEHKTRISETVTKICFKTFDT